MQSSRSISAVYIQSPGTRFSLAVYTLSGTKSTSATYITLAMLNTSISHSKELLNLVKIYINDGKYSGYNNSFIFNLAIFYNIYLSANILFEAKMKAFFTMFKDLALNNCLSNIGISGTVINFDQVYYLIKSKWIK